MKSKPSKHAGNPTKRESNKGDSKGDFISIPKERYNDLILSEKSLLRISKYSFSGSKKSEQWQEETVSFFQNLIAKTWKYKGIREKLLFHGFNFDFIKPIEKRNRTAKKQELFKAWVKRKFPKDYSKLKLAYLHHEADEAFENGELPERISRNTIHDCLPDLRKK